MTDTTTELRPIDRPLPPGWRHLVRRDVDSAVRSMLMGGRIELWNGTDVLVGSITWLDADYLGVRIRSSHATALLLMRGPEEQLRDTHNELTAVTEIV